MESQSGVVSEELVRPKGEQIKRSRKLENRSKIRADNPKSGKELVIRENRGATGRKNRKKGLPIQEEVIKGFEVEDH